jgi:hypothetical protein
MIPKKCPTNYEGVGNDICWHCDIRQKNLCPYKKPTRPPRKLDNTKRDLSNAEIKRPVFYRKIITK